MGSSYDQFHCAHLKLSKLNNFSKMCISYKYHSPYQHKEARTKSWLMSYLKLRSSVYKNTILSHSSSNTCRHVSFHKAPLYPGYFQKEFFSLCGLHIIFSIKHFISCSIYVAFTFGSNSAYLYLMASISVAYELWI